MGIFFVYILKSSACLAIFYLFYKLLLSRETFHRFNRIALLSLFALSVAIPFCEITLKEATVIQRPIMDLESLLLTAQTATIKTESSQFTWLHALIIIYVLGGSTIFGLLVHSFYNLYKIIKKGNSSIIDGIRLIMTNQPVAPFSWMHTVVINYTDYQENSQEIWTHEMAHIKAHHSMDLLISEICILFHWFNPAAWLIQQELRNIHEYEADESVLNQGIDAKQYQLLLIKKAVGSQRFTSMANSFNHNSLKKRIVMMLKQKSNSWARLKYIYVLPLTAITIAAFARPEISKELEKISSAKFSDIIPIPEIIPVDTAKIISIHKPKVDINKLELEEINLEAEKALDEYEKKKPEIEKALAEYEKQRPEVEKALAEYEKKKQEIDKALAEYEKQKPKVEKALAEYEKKRPEIEAMSKLAANQTHTKFESYKGIIFIDGIESTNVDLDNLNPDRIELINVMKGKTAVDKYGERARNGAIEVKTKR